MYPSPINKLISLFSRFPTVGPRTATRFAFHCLKTDSQEIDELISALKEVKRSITFCEMCFRSIEKDKKLCSICSNGQRDKETLCIVEKEADLVSIENTGEYNGLYFILGGTVSPLRKEDFKKVRAKELRERIKKGVKEVILATNQTTEGEATALFITRVLKESNIKTTRLGRGLSTGSELEYADEETLSSALKSRK